MSGESNMPENEQVEQQQEQGTDPFSKYNVMYHIPQVSADRGETNMLNILISDEDIPEEVKKKFYFIFNRDNTLTFLDDDRKKLKLLSFDIIKIDDLNSTRYYDYDFKTEMKFNQLRAIFETKLDRSMGTNVVTQKNERILQQSQFSENRQYSTDMNDPHFKQGFISRLLGKKKK